MKIFLFLLFATTSIIQATAQETFKPDKLYLQDVHRASQLYQKKEYMQSALSYDSLFKKYGGRVAAADKYNAACSWALAGNRDKAFFYLRDLVVADRWSHLSRILSDTDLTALHADSHWQPIIETVRLNKIAVDAKLDKPLVAQLDSIYKEDQGDRKAIEPVRKKYGYASKQWDSLLHTIAYHDSVNLKKVKRIIDGYGWLGPDRVGEDGSLTIFLVIQHADSLTQVRYLPLMREAVRQGKALPQNLALLEDRVLVRQGKPQLYGSQLRSNRQTGKMEFFPIEDEPNVNKRRATVGLGSLEDYAKGFGFDYVLPVTEDGK